MSRRFIAAALAATTASALVAGCAEDKEQTLPPVEPTSSSTATSSTSSTTTSTSPSTTQKAGWTPKNLPPEAPEPLPLNAEQKKAYDAAVAMYNDEYGPVLRRLLKNPVSTQQARRALTPYSTGEILDYTANAVGYYKDNRQRSGMKTRLLWQSPQRVTATRVVMRECTKHRGVVYRAGKPIEPADTTYTNGKATFVLRGDRWLLSMYSGDGDC